LDDREWPWTTKTHSVAEKMRLLEPTAQIWMKIDPYCQRQKCRPMILVSGNIRCMGILVRVPLGGGVKWEWGWRRRQFLAIWVTTSSESSGQQYYMAICYLIAKWMTLNDLEWVAIWRQNPFSASTLNDLERPKRTLLQNRCVFWSPPHKFEWG